MRRGYTTLEFQKGNLQDDLGLTTIEVSKLMYMQIKEIDESVIVVIFYLWSNK